MVIDRPEGRAVWYSIAEPDVIGVLRAGQALLGRTDRKIDLCPNYRAPGARPASQRNAKASGRARARGSKIAVRTRV